MPPACADPTGSAELRHLIAQLESSGLAERRADAAALLAHSRALLEARARTAPSARKAWRKLAILGCLLLDAVGLGLAVFACAGLLVGGWPRWVAPILLLACAGWAVLRLPGLRGALGEAPRIVAYLAGWGWDWFAEAFSEAATRRLESRLDAWALMREWRRRPGAGWPELRDFIADRRGEAAIATLDAATEPRLMAMRWVALMRTFATLSSAPGPAVAAARADIEMPPAQDVQSEPLELAARRADLREEIRRKRAEITTAYGWKLKKPAEIAQRELHVDGLKTEVAALEQALAALG